MLVFTDGDDFVFAGNTDNAKLDKGQHCVTSTTMDTAVTEVSFRGQCLDGGHIILVEKLFITTHEVALPHGTQDLFGRGRSCVPEPS